MYRTLTSAAAAVVLGVSLAGCVTITAAPADPDATYIAAVRDALPAKYAAATDDILIEVARNGCAVLDEGGTVDMIVATAIANDFPAADAATIARAGIPVYCPEHEGEL